MIRVQMSKVIQDYSPCAGRHWFDSDTLHWFRCRLSHWAFENASGDRFFVTSESASFGGSAPRLYTVRVQRADDLHAIHTVGAFQQYGSRASAVRAAKAFASM